MCCTCLPPEVGLNMPCTTASHIEERHDLLLPMPCIHAGPSSIAAVVGAGSVASSELSVEEQQKAEQHAVHAFTYENVFSQVSLLANTQVIDYRCFAFLELASDTSATHPLSMVLRSSNILDSVAQSYSSCKDSCLPPPLAAVTTAAFSQL